MTLISPRRRARARWLILTLCVTILGLSLGGGMALAGKGGGSTTTVNPLSPSGFEAGDGNTIDEAGYDWATAKSWTSGDRSYTSGDDIVGPTDDSFGQGTKENATNPTVVQGSIPPNKNDLTTFSVATERSSGISFLYLNWRRAINTGNANLDFEINQDASANTSLTDGSTGVKVLRRTTGDHLITFDYATTSKPSISMYTWSEGTSSWYPTNGVLLSTSNYAVAAVDATTGLFGEVGINLTASGFFGTGSCKTFGSAWVKSRSSTSFTAEVKDFIKPIPVKITNCFPRMITTFVPNLAVSITDITTGLMARLSVQLYPDSNCNTTIAYSDGTTFTNGLNVVQFTTRNTGVSDGTTVPPNGFSITSGTYYWKVRYEDSRNTPIEECAVRSFTAPAAP